MAAIKASPSSSVLRMYYVLVLTRIERLAREALRSPESALAIIISPDLPIRLLLDRVGIDLTFATALHDGDSGPLIDCSFRVMTAAGGNTKCGFKEPSAANLQPAAQPYTRTEAPNAPFVGFHNPQN